jgi:hypothetical protein
MFEDTLESGFRAPPAIAKPRVYWFWMNGNVTEEGIRLDLEWMQRVGIGGVQNFDAAYEFGAPYDTPPRVEKPMVYLTPEWQRALRYSVGLAHELGLEFTVASSAGFSHTGGPWVTPRQAMKKLVWSETWVHGGMRFNGCLAEPPHTTGMFQNIPLVEQAANKGERAADIPNHYADVATIAYRAPASELPSSWLNPTVTSSAGLIDAAPLVDGDLTTAVSLPFGDDRYAWIRLSFGEPVRIQAVTIAIRHPVCWDPLLEPLVKGWVEAGDDGQRFVKVADLPTSGVRHSSALQQTVSFRPTVARVFRVMLERPDPNVYEQLGLTPPRLAHELTALRLHTGARVNRFEDKAGYSTREILESDDTPAVPSDDVARKSEIIDLTGRMRAGGHLDWNAPEGEWVVLRFGYSLTGRVNAGSSRAGRGLEVDKLNREHVEAYLDAYLAAYEEALGKELIGERGLQFMITDSYEAGPQNWTDDMLEQFKQRRGYDALPWLPVFAGRIVESAQSSDRFLWDFRKTIGDLMAEAYYGQLSASLHRRCLGRYSESHEVRRAFVGDGMEAKRTADIPMGAIWADSPAVLDFSLEGADADLRESASVAHIYGKKLVAGESFTALTILGDKTYGFTPETLKPLADRAMAMGLNRFVIHASVHQPDSKPGPGMGLGPFGQWFTRHETWAEAAGPWVTYLTRSCYLLQQGRFVADIAYLYGEDTNITSLFHANATPIVPEGYNFDFINSEAVLSELSVKEGRLTTRAGMEYRVLALDASTRRMTLALIRKIRDLVRAGAVVVGSKPARTPSLADDEVEFRAIAGELWGEKPAVRSVGYGKVFWDGSLAQALAAMHLQADVTWTKSADAVMRFVHRKLDDADLYFVSNGTAEVQDVEAAFRVTGKAPELWRADTGEVAALSCRIANQSTIVPLKLDPHDAIFVIFRHPTDKTNVVVPKAATETLTALDGPWELKFAPNLGAPEGARFETLISWTESADFGVKYFSGTATYDKTISIRSEWLRGEARILLDLGKVKAVAEVLINDRPLGVVWKRPFRVDVTDALRAGENRLELRITNLWPNRLIGDKQPGARKIAFANFDPFQADTPLQPAGLLGPVTVLRASLPHWCA